MKHHRYTSRPVKSTLEPLEGNNVKLSIAVDESEFDHDIDAAFRKIAKEVRLPGFRPGKAPRRILDVAFWGMFGLLALLSLAMFIASFLFAKMRARMQRT